jgi:D-alanyl-D-alanine carboxypeptidase/D-alanyl-D-alanine-endopeptidase (penicillin-binding protein 4)
MILRPTRFIATLASLVLLLLVQSVGAEGATRKHPRRKRSHKAAARPPEVAAVGKTFEERLSSLVNGSVARSSESSIEVVDVDTGTVVAERNAHLPLAPASNMKLFTTAAAMDLLHPNFEVTTTVFMRGTVDLGGTLAGDVRIVGRGDPTIGGRFHDGRATEVLEEWATDLKRAGVKTIKGDLVFEYGYMDMEYIHPTWPVDQLVNWYEAPVSAFSLQEGCVQVRVLPSRPGKRAVVQLEPSTRYLTVENSCVTGRGLPFVTRERGGNNIIVRGRVPARSGAHEFFVTVMNPVEYFATVTRETFERNGVRILGQVMMTPRDPRADWRFVTRHSTPLNILVYVINKKSQNHYAEELLKIVGAETRQEGSWQAGTGAVTEWLSGKLGVPPEEFQQADGSGMSRNNRASSDSFIHLLRYMWNSPYREDFVSSLPYSGDPDAKFGHRLRSAPWARQVYAKTGYIAGVVGLSGYVHAQSGRIYAFSILFNRYHVGVYAIYQLQDAMLKEIIKNG